MKTICSHRHSAKSLKVLMILFVTTLTAMSFMTGCNRSHKEKPLRIGAVIPLTGDSAAWGEQAKWGIDFAVRKVNKAGGIDGRQVEVIFEDSQAVPRLAISAFNKLSQVDGVQAVVGDVVSATTLAMAPLAEERHVILIGISSSAPSLTNAGDFIFRVWPSDLLEGAAAADWARSQDTNKVSILHIATDYGSGLSAAFRAKFEGQGRKIASVQSYGQDQTDFRPYLIRVKSESPDLLYIIGYYKDTALILKQAKEIGIATRFLGATAVESQDLLKIAGDAAEGLVYPTIVDFDPSNPTASQKQFMDEFKTTYGKEPDWVSSHSYDATLVILEAMKSGALKGDDIRSAIDKRRVFEGVTGTIRFDENGDVIDKPVIMKTVKGGAFVVLTGSK